MRTCTKCSEVLPDDDFRIQVVKDKKYRKTICRKCERKYSREWATAHPRERTDALRKYQKQYKEEHREHLNELGRKYYHEDVPKRRRQAAKHRDSSVGRNSYLKRRYGITLKEFNERLENQGNRCAICGSNNGQTSKRSNRFHVDHDHKSGKIRGILCHKCNLGVGQFDDSQELLGRAIKYLNQFP